KLFIGVFKVGCIIEHYISFNVTDYPPSRLAFMPTHLE
ncbi:MAG: hypothetical protein RIQ94_2928, partial [Pseudomonadota bacterium]